MSAQHAPLQVAHIKINIAPGITPHVTLVRHALQETHVVRDFTL